LDLILIIVTVVVVALFLLGVFLMRSPDTALRGNRIKIVAMLVALGFALSEGNLWDKPEVWLLLGFGALLGLLLAWRLEMVQMPQAVALFNALGGGASALVAIVLMMMVVDQVMIINLTLLLTVMVGAVTFFGSSLAALKLQGYKLVGLSSSLPGVKASLVILLLGLLTGAVSLAGPPLLFVFAPVAAILVVLYGVVMVLRVGGADMPIIISLLNSLSGAAASLCGISLQSPLLAGTGAVVGVAGLLLTRSMCVAMNRSLSTVLAGFSTVAATKEEPAPEESEEELVAEEDEEEGTLEDRAAAALQGSQRIIMVPGYGMALAQAQGAVKELVEALESRGKEVKMAIHPVAGRMPGHMNVLLAEVGVSYEKLYDLETINPDFPHADLVIVIGACDVVNPAANTAEGTPIYGMPILEVDKAHRVIVLNKDDAPGYSGVENPLYQNKKVITWWGDAGETVEQLKELLD